VQKINIGLVSNCSNTSVNSFSEREKFSKIMQAPVITSLCNSRNYVSSAAQVLSLFEIPNHKIIVDKQQWKPLVYWAESRLLIKRQSVRSATHGKKHLD
jgi:hypothetical protein